MARYNHPIRLARKTDAFTKETRQLLHKMLDEMIDYQREIRENPVWKPPPKEIVQKWSLDTLPKSSTPLAQVHEKFSKEVKPFVVGNSHGGFLGWVHGGSTLIGLASEMLIGGINPNCGGRNQMPIVVERQVVRWTAEMLDFPKDSSGVLVTGSSQANFLSVIVARTRALGTSVRQKGLQGCKLVAYACKSAHNCVAQGFDLAGLGKNALRMIPYDSNFQMDTLALEQVIKRDLAEGFVPFFVAATAGTVDTGSVDPLESIANICQRYSLWFHIDGAFGSLLKLSPVYKHLVKGLERADSIALDFHKWLQVPYDCGLFLCRHAELHTNSFGVQVGYLRREDRGLAGGGAWPTDYGPDLSRGFRALKAWMTLSTYGVDRLGEMITHNCLMAEYCKQLILLEPKLQLVNPVASNVVVFYYKTANVVDQDKINSEIAIRLQEEGRVAPSTNVIDHLCIRACFVNHRNRREDVENLVRGVVYYGDLITGLDQ